MSHVYGIDAGTTSSAIAVGLDDGTVLRVKDPGSAHGSVSSASSACVLRNGTVAVGAAAEAVRIARAEHYWSEFKREFATPVTRMLGGRHRSAADLTTELLAFLRREAGRRVPGEPEAVVVTVPVSWERGRRELMTSVLAASGFTAGRIELRDEPVAAAAHVLGRNPDVGPTLVYDLGGGTFDCAVVRPSPGGIEVLGRPGGLPDVGGSGFDRLLLRHVATVFPREWEKLTAQADSDATLLRGRRRLLDACRTVKVQLSVVDTHEEYLPDLGPDVVLEMTRRQLDDLLRPALAATLAECERMLGELALTWGDIDRILPVGGSTRLPAVNDLLRLGTGRPILPVGDPDLATVHGAVDLARGLIEPPAPQPVPEPEPEPDPEPAPLARRPSVYRPEASPFD
ncbi:Hsp70 family protein [Kineosporia sp. J2-2]|uniref:Hsp70 family protein n=1 Tax=Kineosporia corallincola TaxID=2835133 RepID=A0ABS5TQ75_9ACTN|nr:Hsp70 family protein [Kineosporia corallincola]MBT0773265.1 Hsp70 family protein [Kineosporia corallincola]